MIVVQTENLSNLINSDRVRSSVRRLFQNDIAECLSELFQNSQRARARRVEITTGEEGYTYRDDGHGLLDGVEGFHTLLKIAESHFDNPHLADQDPMGLGIHALLAHDQIKRVTFASGSYRLTLETKRWWTDRDYYMRWYERLEELAEKVADHAMMAIQRAGFIITRRNFLLQSQTTPQMADDDGRHFFQLREVAQPLKTLSAS